MIIVGCSNSVELAKRIANKLKLPFSQLIVKHFPDGELYVRFGKPKELKNNVVTLIQTLHPNPSEALAELYFASKTAKELGVAKVIAIVPYLAYMRQDKAFRAGECISSRRMAEIINSCADELITIDPHLHRIKSLNEIFSIKTTKLTAIEPIANYIKKNFKNEIIVGPDIESYQWAQTIAEKIKVEATILRKRRWTATKVKIRMPPVLKKEIKNKNVIIIDDVISSGATILEAAKLLKPLKPKSITAIATHGIFAAKALEKLKKEKINVITTNTITNPVSRIDVSELIAKALKL